MGHTILVIDDEPPIRFALRRYFGSRGWQVDTAARAAEAVKLIERSSYDAAIIDLRLIEGNVGFGLVDLLRSHSPETRVLMLTAYGSPEVEWEARRRGVDAFLNKPKPLPEIAELLWNLMEEPPSARPARPAESPFCNRESRR